MSARVRWGFDRKAGAKARPVPLVRAYRGPWPIVAHRTMAEVMRDEDAALGVSTSLDTNGAGVIRPAPKKVALPRIKSGATKQDPGTGMPPEPVSAPVVVSGDCPLPNPLPAARATITVAPIPAGPPWATEGKIAPPKITLADAPSGMESTARQWIKPPSLACTVTLPPVPDCAAKVWCSGCDARVPAWFGRDCIATHCDLRGAA